MYTGQRFFGATAATLTSQDGCPPQQQCTEGVKRLHQRLITFRTKCYCIQDFITFRTKRYYIQDFTTFRTVITFRPSTDPSLFLLSFFFCAGCIICVIWCFIFYLVGLQHRMSDCSKRVMSNHIRYNRPNRRALYRNLGIGSCSNRNIPSVFTKCHVAMF